MCSHVHVPVVYQMTVRKASVVFCCLYMFVAACTCSLSVLCVCLSAVRCSTQALISTRPACQIFVCVSVATLSVGCPFRTAASHLPCLLAPSSGLKAIM
jgi:hypothetical protein